MPTPLATPRSGASLPPIDPRVIADLRALADGGDEFRAEVVGEFRDEAPPRLAAIPCAASTNGCRDLLSVTPAPTGGARTPGLLRPAQVCGWVETLPREGALADLGVRDGH
jgi:hypothetical protein